MKPESGLTTETVINENGSLQSFYKIADKLFKKRKFRFAGSEDAVDNIEWHFTYRGKSVTLQYNIYSGVSLLYNGMDEKRMDKLAGELRKEG